ncbi:hypothetical protein BX666DRAFT_2028545 [Dichotomocladium elegans]|nr:hypothetical protein BX666DRAFT_2028545 [Dichotomocladium elegans]
MKSPKWFNRIRRRSSDRAQHIGDEHIAYDEEIQELECAYEFALDELAYAIESQGSIYYDGDRETAQEAFDTCVGRYRFLMDHLSDADCVKLSARYYHALQDLHTQLSQLPCLY